MRLDTETKKDLQVGLPGFVKAGKLNKKGQASSFLYI